MMLCAYLIAAGGFISFATKLTSADTWQNELPKMRWMCALSVFGNGRTRARDALRQPNYYLPFWLKCDIIGYFRFLTQGGSLATGKGHKWASAELKVGLGCQGTDDSGQRACFQHDCGPTVTQDDSQTTLGRWWAARVRLLTTWRLTQELKKPALVQVW